MKLSPTARLLVSLPALALSAAIFQGCLASTTDTETDADADTDVLDDEVTEESADALAQADVLTSTLVDIPQPASGKRTLACESRWTNRQLILHPDSVVPRRQYATSCQKPDGKYRMYVSATVTSDQTYDPQTSGSFDGTSGMVFAFDVKDDDTVTLASSRHLPECKEMGGITAKSDCSVVAALCRRPSGASGGSVQPQETVDMVERFAPNGAEPNPKLYGALRVAGMDQQWIYQWTGSPVSPGSVAPQQRWVVSKAIGGWEFGHQGIAYDPTGQTYGLSLKSHTAPDANGTEHERDVFLLVDRTAKLISSARSDFSGSCNGHPHANRIAFNAAAGNYAYQCGTDKAAFGEVGKYGGINLVIPKKAANVAKVVTPVVTLPRFGAPAKVDGGAGSILPLSDGGYLGVIVAAPKSWVPSPDQNFHANGPLSTIQVVRYAKDGSLTWRKVVKSSSSNFLAQPLIAQLGSNRFLVTWGVMGGTGLVSGQHNLLRVPQTYKTVEIDGTGAVLPNTETTLSNTGWGEQDQMVSLGAGRAGWAYIDAPAAKVVNGAVTIPSCFSQKLKVSVYHN